MIFLILEEIKENRPILPWNRQKNRHLADLTRQLPCESTKAGGAQTQNLISQILRSVSDSFAPLIPGAGGPIWHAA